MNRAPNISDAGDVLRARAAQVLGWSFADACTLSWGALREAIRTKDAPLHVAMGDHASTGGPVTNPKVSGYVYCAHTGCSAIMIGVEGDLCEDCTGEPGDGSCDGCDCDRGDNA